MAIKIKKISPKQFAKAVTRPVAATVRTVTRPVAATVRTVTRPVAATVRTVDKTIKKTLVNTKAMPIKIKKISPKDFGRAVAKGVAKTTGFDPQKIKSAKDFGKQLGKGVYQVSGAKQLVTSGKALSKCKPKDAKCIAANLGGIAAVGIGKIPGVGFVAGVAMSQGLQQAQAKATRDAAKKKEADKKLELAKRNAAAATTPAAKAAADAQLNKAQAEDEKAIKELKDAEAKVSTEQDKAIEVQKAALETIKSLPPDQQDQAFAQSQQAIAKPPDTGDVAAVEAAAGTKLIAETQNEQSKALEAISKQIEGPTIYGMPQSKFMMFAGGIAFFILLLIILLK